MLKCYFVLYFILFLSLSRNWNISSSRSNNITINNAIALFRLEEVSLFRNNKNALFRLNEVYRYSYQAVQFSITLRYCYNAISLNPKWC